jgi:hypothetical protein
MWPLLWLFDVENAARFFPRLDARRLRSHASESTLGIMHCSLKGAENARLPRE